MKIIHSRRWILKRINVAAEDRGHSAIVEEVPGRKVEDMNWGSRGSLGGQIRPSLRSMGIAVGESMLRELSCSRTVLVVALRGGIEVHWFSSRGSQSAVRWRSQDDPEQARQGDSSRVVQLRSRQSDPQCSGMPALDGGGWSSSKKAEGLLEMTCHPPRTEAALRDDA